MTAWPEPHADEREQLLAYLAAQRYALRLAAHGLSDEEARLSPTAGDLSVGGIIKHLTRAEAHWIDIVLGRQEPFDASATDYQDGFRLGPDETLAGALTAYDAVATQTESVVRSLPVEQQVPVPRDVPWFPRHVEAWTLRWVLLHLIEETARHAGHADIVRESIDGATWFPLLAAAEGWEPTPWLQPWEPAASNAGAHR